jgi:hypothetical protein
MRPNVIGLSVLLVVLISFAAQPLPAPASGARPSDFPVPLPGAHFVHVATADNIVGNWTYLDHPLLNGNHNAVFFVSQNWNPKGMDGTFNDEAIGVWYSVAVGKWGIFNQDGTDMPEEAAFNVHIPVEDVTRFVHEATSGNSYHSYTMIDNPLLNGHPGATVFVTQNWNPPGEPGVYNEHVVGVWYYDDTEKWYIMNEDQATMPVGASFNALVSSPDETVILHVATTENTSGYLAKIDDPRINGNPNGLLTSDAIALIPRQQVPEAAELWLSPPAGGS